MVGTYPPIQLGVLSPDILGAYDAPDPYGTATLFVAGEAFELPLGQIEDTFVPAWNGIEWGGVALTPDVDLRLRVRLTDGDLVNDDPIGTVVVDGIDIRAALDARQVVPVRVDDQGAPILLVAITVIEQQIALRGASGGVMSLPKKGSRIVEADSERYRWLIRRKPTYFQGLQAPMTLAVEAVDGQRGGILHVGLRVSRPDNWIAPHQTAVTPKVVRQIIAAARAAGWQPEAGGVFEFEYGLIRDRSQVEGRSVAGWVSFGDRRRAHAPRSDQTGDGRRAPPPASD